MATYVDPATGKRTTHRPPPVIPEIAKAYQNDPQTQIGLAALKSGTSTAPVARGKYGIGDGVARIAQALIGAKMEQRENSQYGDQQDQLLALRKARGVDGLSGAGANIPNVAPPNAGPPGAAPAVPAAAPQIAAALGAPAPPAGPPQSAPGLPMAPVPPPAPVPPQGPPLAPPGPEALTQGGGPNGRPPFGSPSAGTANAPPYLAPPTQDRVPDAPAPVARPVRPDAVGPTRSRMLNAAYRVMEDANPYESSQGQDMYQEGLGEQTKLDEAATNRKQALIDAEYATDRGMYAQGAEQDREEQYHARDAVVAHNQKVIDDFKDRMFQYGVHKDDQTFQHGENQAKMANERTVEGMRVQGELAVEKAKQSAVLLAPESVQAMAGQLLAGDPSPLQYMGRGTNGAMQTAQVRNEMYKQASARGISPQQLASINAQFFGQKAEARAAGTRVGATDVATSEVPALADEARYRHAALMAQGNLVPWNTAVQMVQRNTSSPELARAVSVNSAVINAYARSFGTGVVSNQARDQATKQLSTAWGTPAYEAALDQIVRNTQMERSGAKKALNSIGGPVPTTATPGAPSSGWGKVRVQ